MVRERLKIQEDLHKSYPDMPMIDSGKVLSFSDYAYAAHDQATFLIDAMNEIK